MCVHVVCFRAGWLCRPRRRRWARRRRRRRWRRSRRSRLFVFFRSPQSTEQSLPQVPWWVLVVSGGGLWVRLGAAAACACLRNKTSQRLCLRAKVHSIGSFPKLRLSYNERAFVCWFAHLRGSERRLFVVQSYNQGAFKKTRRRPLKVGRWITGKPTAKKNAVLTTWRGPNGQRFTAQPRAHRARAARALRATTTNTATARHRRATAPPPI